MSEVERDFRHVFYWDESSHLHGPSILDYEAVIAIAHGHTHQVVCSSIANLLIVSTFYDARRIIQSIGFELAQEYIRASREIIVEKFLLAHQPMIVARIGIVGLTR